MISRTVTPRPRYKPRTPCCRTMPRAAGHRVGGDGTVRLEVGDRCWQRARQPARHNITRSSSAVNEACSSYTFAPPLPRTRPQPAAAPTCVCHGCIHGRLPLCCQRGAQQVKGVGGHSGSGSRQCSAHKGHRRLPARAVGQAILPCQRAALLQRHKLHRGVRHGQQLARDGAAPQALRVWEGRRRVGMRATALQLLEPTSHGSHSSQAAAA